MIVFIGSKYGNIEEGFATKGRKKELKELVDGANKLLEQEGEMNTKSSWFRQFCRYKT